MALSRADTLTGTIKQQEYFSDFLDNFTKTPFGNQLGKVTNQQSVNQSLRNLISTNLGERLFQPMIGSNVSKSLFEPFSTISQSNRIESSSSSLEFFIRNTIENNEPRVILIDIIVKTAYNNTETDVMKQRTGVSDENSVVISIVYRLINNIDPITLNYVLKRVR
jgi:phage baseplate assembly protein W